jgi:UPF0716 family protein affecting phage T7 exclusion
MGHTTHRNGVVYFAFAFVIGLPILALLADFALAIVIANAMGVWVAVAYVVVAFLIGIVIAKFISFPPQPEPCPQGSSIEAEYAMERIAMGMLLLMSVLPGGVSDLIVLVCLVPPVRLRIVRHLTPIVYWNSRQPVAKQVARDEGSLPPESRDSGYVN